MFNLKDHDGVLIRADDDTITYGIVETIDPNDIIVKTNTGDTLVISKTASTLCIPPDEWLKEQFECEYCECCGGDAEDHDAVPFNGNWFARCKHDLPEHLTDSECEVEMKLRRDRKDRGLPLVPDTGSHI